MTHSVPTGELPDGHPVPGNECPDRICLNACVPALQSSGQVAAFMTRHPDKPVPPPALMEQAGTKFRRAAESCASSSGIPLVRFASDGPKAAVMQPHTGARAATGRSGATATSACGTRTPGRRPSGPAPASPARPGPGSAAASGPDGRRPGRAPGSLSCPAGPPRVMTRPGRRPSTAGSRPAPPRSSPGGGSAACPCPPAPGPDAGYRRECPVRQAGVSGTTFLGQPCRARSSPRGAHRRQPRPRPPRERRDRLRPPGPRGPRQAPGIPNQHVNDYTNRARLGKPRENLTQTSRS